MTKVGIVISFAEDWIGGLNYYKNLINAVYSLPERNIEFVIFTNTNSKLENITEFSKLKIVRSRLFDRLSFLWLVRKSIMHFFRADPLFIQCLKSHQIDVLSHSGWLGKRSPIPTIGWIPDFQHIHLPMFFSKKNRQRRDAEFKRIGELCSKIILSSKDAQKDMHRFMPDSQHKTVVLNFAINPSLVKPDQKVVSLESLEGRYQFSRPYFLLPNQFWVHKNHQVVIEALHLLKQTKPSVLIIATGNTVDPRNPSHYEALIEDLASRGLKENFKSCGVVPSEDLYSLMRYAQAVINPSFFEGWSTSVEEAKVLGKRVILSDIPVHREQNPEYGVYFDPKNPAELAQLLAKYSVETEPVEIKSGRYEAAKENYQRFARAYQTLTEQVLNVSN